MKLRYALLFIVALLGSVVTAEGLSPGRRAILFGARPGSHPDFFVSTNGSDSNSCRTAGSACGTIAGVQSKLRAALAAHGKNRPWIVEVAGGTYQLPSPLVFSAADSGGSSINRVTWQAAQGEKPILSGGREITGWADVGGIWEKAISEIATGIWNPRNLWINDERRLRPRTPSFDSYLSLAGYGTIGNAPTNKVNQFVYEGADLNAAMTNPTDADLMIMATWTGELLGIAGIDGESRTVTTTGWTAGNRTVNSINVGNRYWVENVFENLTSQPGTFYVDRTPSSSTFLGKLKYKPKDGETINSMRMVIPVMDQLLFVSNTNNGAATVRHITFKGITFAHTDRRPPVNGAYGTLYGMSDPSAINVAGATDIIFDGVTVRNTGGTGISFGHGCEGCQVVNSTIGDTGSIGIQVTKYIPGSAETAVKHYAQNAWVNPHFVGSTSTSPGVNLFFNKSINGISAEFAVGYESGIPFLDINLSGTNTLGANFDYVVRTTSPYPAGNGEAFDIEGFIKLAAGTSMGIGLADIQLQMRKGSSFLASLTSGKLQKTGPQLSGGFLHAQIVSAILTTNNAAIDGVTGALRIQILAGAAVNATIRFGGIGMRSRKFWPLAVASPIGPQTIIDSVIRNNYVFGVGRIHPEAAAIAVNNSTGLIVENNRIGNSYGPGLVIGLVVGNNSCDENGVYSPNPIPLTSNGTVRRNYISDTGQNVTSDLGAIYLAGNSPGTEIYENVIYRVDGYKPPEVGVYLDEDASNLSVFRNTLVDVHGAAFFHHFGININIVNNIVYNSVLSAANNEFNGAAFAAKPNDKCVMTNVNDSFVRNVVRYTEVIDSLDQPRIYGKDTDLTDTGPYTFKENIYHIVPFGGPPKYFERSTSISWTDWTTTFGQDSETRFIDPEFSGIVPFVYPNVKPTGWIDWNPLLAGLTEPHRSLGFPSPIATYP